MMDVFWIWGSFFLAGSLFTFWEKLAPRRQVRYRSNLKNDIGAFAVVFTFFLIVGALAAWLEPILVPAALKEKVTQLGFLELPLWGRVVIFYLIWDLSLYWVHRLMHTNWLWPTHRWHHVPTSLWWFVGVRGSFPHIFLTYLPFLWFQVLSLPTWLVVPISVHAVVGNAWMHVNITGKWMRPLEWFFVTPRFHVIHHSSKESFYRANLGSMFTIWDRLFGTYVCPDAVEEKILELGIKEKVSPFRLIRGF